MVRIVQFVFLAVCLIGVSIVWSAPTAQPFSYYQPILDRMPFGTPPPNFDAAPVDPVAAKNEEQAKVERQNLAKRVNMSAVTVTPEGHTAVGFTDLAKKLNHYLLVGETADGWKVLAADYDEETATLEKDGINVTLKLGSKDPVAMPVPPPAAGTAEAKPPPGNLIPGLVHSPARPAASGMAPTARPAAPPPLVSYKTRLLERSLQETKKRQDAAQQQREKLVQLAREAAREAAQKEIARREEEAAQAAETQDTGMPEGQVPDEQPPPGDRPMSRLQEGNVE